MINVYGVQLSSIQGQVGINGENTQGNWNKKGTCSQLKLLILQIDAIIYCRTLSFDLVREVL